MSQALIVLTGTAAFIGFLHTLLGPDHYLPFIVMAKARRWSITKTGLITFLCGIGHVGSSVLLGMIGIAFGIALGKLEITESFRGDIAAWLLTAFGLVYLVWGIRRAIRNKPHTHLHVHGEDLTHAHEHAHHADHVHPHEQAAKVNLTPWVLFTIFVFGPCEPLIPILMYPAAAESLWGTAIVASVFAAATIGTMLAVVLIGTYAMNLLPTGRLERYSHALAGAVILLCGVAIHLGL
ncbi:MAG: urease accessory protein UreH domain-containing protein [Planctomycetota bacterium]|jgi:sulfite exporter TauE/SafE